MSIKFKKENNRGIVIFKGAYNLANAYRRTILSEIETRAFDLSNIKKEFSPNIGISTDVVLNIKKVKFLNQFEPPEKNEIYHLSIKNTTNKYMPIFSENICNTANKSADVQKGILLFYLPPDSFVKISNICVKFAKEMGEHVAHSPIIGPVTYMPTDIYPVFYLNERGYIDPSPRFVPCAVIKREIKYYTYQDLFKNEKHIIIYNKEYAKLAQSEVLERINSMEKIEIDTKHFCDTRYFKSADHTLTFYAIDIERTHKEAMKTLKANIEKAQYNDYMSDTVAELFYAFCFSELECPVYINSIDDNAKITVINDNPEKIFEQVKKKLLGFFKD